MTSASSMVVGGVLRTTAGKAVMLLNNDITHILGSLQLSKGNDAGGEAVVPAMHESFFEENTDWKCFTNKCRKCFQSDQSKGKAL